MSAAGRAELPCQRRLIAMYRSADAQGVLCFLGTGMFTDALSILTGHALGRLYSGCSHLKCLRRDESGHHFIFRFIVTVEIYVLWLKRLLLVKCRSNMIWPDQVNDHGFVYPYCGVDSLKLALVPLCRITVFRHEVT